MRASASCDVVVIGGGPGGSVAATLLSQAGWQVILLEKQSFPRYMVGESLIPDFWKYCDEVGVSERIEAEGFVKKAGGTIEWNGETRQLAFRDFGYSRPALHVERERFDAILLDNARGKGVQILEGAVVHYVKLPTEEGASAQVGFRHLSDGTPGTIRCRYVVDASGQSAVLGRQLALRVMNEDFRFMSIWGYFRGSAYVAADGQIYPASHVKTVPPTTYVTNLPALGDWGWCWHIMLRDQTSVGLVVPVTVAKHNRAPGASWEQFFLAECARLPGLSKLLEPATFVPGSVRVIRNYSYDSTKVAGPGYFLIGDAAGFIDPIFSVGVVLAMYSAYLAAWAIDNALKTRSRATEYQSIYSTQLQGRMELGRAIALPGYERGAQATLRAREIVAMSSEQAQNLMRAASLVTARPHNFGALLSTEG